MKHREKRIPQVPQRLQNISPLLAMLPPLIMATVELLKEGHALGWW